MAEVGVDHDVLLGRDFVVGGELRTRGADGVHQAGEHEDLGFDARGEVLQVDVAELGEDFGFALVARVEEAEVIFELGVGVLGLVHFPDALVVAEEGEDGGGAFDARFEGGAGDGEGAALGAAHGADAGGIDFGERHDGAGELGRIQKNVTEKEIVGVGIVETADDVSAQGVAEDAAHVLGFAALAAAVHRGDAETLAGVGEFSGPVAAVAGVAVELEDGGSIFGAGGAEVFGVDAGAADAGEPEVEAFDALGGDGGGRDELRGGRGGVEFAEGFGPVGVEVGGARVAALIGAEFGERFVDEGHGRGIVQSLEKVKTYGAGSVGRRRSGGGCRRTG